MPARVNSLDRIKVESPCTADWEEMIGNDRVRFCAHCNLSVHNLSQMTRREALKLVAASDGRLCVRYIRRPDGLMQTANSSPQLHAIKRRASRFAAGAFTAAMSLTSAMAQSSSQANSPQPEVAVTQTTGEAQPTEACDSFMAVLEGAISDEHGAGVTGARVVIVSLKTKQELATMTDSEGGYRFQALGGGLYTLTVEAPGFDKNEMGSVYVQANTENLANRTLSADGVVRVFATAGGMMIVEPEDPLVKAVMDDDMGRVKELLAGGADVNALDKNINATPLIEAIWNGNLEMIHTLLAAGADVNARNGRRQTVLMMMGERTTVELVRVLIDAGAKVNLKDEDGDTALTTAAAYDKSDVLRALIDAGAKVDARNNEGKTALMIAAADGVTGNVKMLLEAGADVRRKDKDGATALKLARDNETDNDHREVIQLLQAYGAFD